MKTNEFENKIKQLHPELRMLCVKLNHGHVHWFICADSWEHTPNLIIFDSEGQGYMCASYQLPENDDWGGINVERATSGSILVDGSTKGVSRDRRFDLYFNHDQ